MEGDMIQEFSKEVLQRLPLAEAVLWLWSFICDQSVLDDLFDQNRGRCYERELPFSVMVNLVADALLEHSGSGRKSFQRGRENGELEVSIVSAYGKLSRVPQAVSEAFLADGTVRLMTLVPPKTLLKLPASLSLFSMTVLDGKAVKRVPKRLKPLQGCKGGVLGGKGLAALDLASSLVVAMATSLDGDTNDAKLVPDLVAQVQALRRKILWIGDRQFCDLTQTREFASRETDHFVVRYHKRVQFHADPSRPARTGTDCEGRTYTEDWGWLGATRSKKRLYVRRIKLKRPGEEMLILITDLLDSEAYPADDLLTAYRTRWGIERVFQQITEVFELEHLIGTTPQGTLFQLSFCLLLYNMIQVIRAYVAKGAKEEVAAISTELLFDDVRRQLIALHETLAVTEIVPLIPQALTAELVREQLTETLKNVWTERWRKSPSKKPKPADWKTSARTHSSAYRVIMEARLAKKTKPKATARP
jgi:hypothetical protein